MKSIKIFAVAGAIGLLGLAGLSSCKQNSSNMPEYNGETVKTEFAISIPEAGKGGSIKYMPSTTVQRDGASQFQGITSIKLVPFARQSGLILKTDNRLGKNISLSGDVESADIAKPSSARVYTDVSIPITTSSFLFYGVSKASGTKFQVGSLIPDIEDVHTTPADFTFDLEQIYTSNPLGTGAGYNLLYYINSVAQASDGSKEWRDYTDSDDAAMTAMFNTYKSMTGLSSFNVARIMQDLYNTLQPIDGSNALAHAIRAAIKNDTYVSISGTDANCTITMNTGYDNFPAEHKLPEGSIQVTWDGGTKKFVQSDYLASNFTDPANYTYPAQLWYYVNSLIETSDKSQKDQYNGVNDWNSILDKHEHNAPTGVNTLTRAVAIKDPVQYAVARLDVQVKLNGSSLADNSETVVGIPTAVDCSSGFPVTAILVGGQKQVGFDFTPNTSAPERTIYDNIMSSKVEATPSDMIASAYGSGVYSTINHTLVLESNESKVRIAVEMENNTGVDFYGNAGQLIPKNGKFYVVAELDATDATETGNKVFKQDYTTTAKLTLTDLKKAYNTIPDLRTPKLEIGFSVDLTWQNGHTYTINFE